MSFLVRTYKNAYGGLSASTWWLSFVMLVNRSGTMVVPFMTLYLTHNLHVGIGKAGFVMAVFGAGAICGGFIGGRLTDKFGFYNIQLTALLSGGVLFIVLGQLLNYTAICICTFCLSIFNESFRPANATAIAHYSNEENRVRSYSLNRLSINLGWALGGAFGGWICSYNYKLLFWIDGCTNIAAALLLVLVLSPQRNVNTPSAKKTAKADSAASPYRDKIYLWFIFFSIMYSYCFFQWFTTIPVFYNKDLHLSPAMIGTIMAINGLLIALFEMVIVFRLQGRWIDLKYISMGTLLIGVSFVLFNIMGGTVLPAVLAMLITTVGEILSMPFMNSFWISRSKPESRGQYAGLYTIAWSTAQVLGPGTGSQIAEHWGFHTLWWMMGIMCLVTFLGYRWLLTKIKT